MKGIAKVAGILVLASLLLFGTLFVGQYFAWWNLSFFGPKVENTRREIFENTQSYVESRRQALTKYYREFCQSDNESKCAIRDLMLQDFANFEISRLTETQKKWYDEMANFQGIEEVEP